MYYNIYIKYYFPISFNYKRNKYITPLVLVILKEK